MKLRKVCSDNKSLIIIKKIIFLILFIYLQCGCAFHFIFCISGYSFINHILYQLNWDLIFYNDGILLPVSIFWPALVIILVLIWIFYRKEITMKSRILITVESLWSIATYYISVLLDGKNVWSALVFILIDIFIVIDLLKYSKFGKTDGSIKTNQQRA